MTTADQRQNQARVSLVCDAVGDLASVARLGQIPASDLTAWLSSRNLLAVKSDPQAAVQMQEAKRTLFAGLHHKGRA